MLKNIKMKWMLIASMLVAGLIPLIGTGFYALNQAQEALTQIATTTLQNIYCLVAGEISDNEITAINVK